MLTWYSSSCSSLKVTCLFPMSCLQTHSNSKFKALQFQMCHSRWRTEANKCRKAAGMKNRPPAGGDIAHPNSSILGMIGYCKVLTVGYSFCKRDVILTRWGINIELTYLSWDCEIKPRGYKPDDSSPLFNLHIIKKKCKQNVIKCVLLCLW